MIWHNGETGGFASYLRLVKESNTAVVVLSDSEKSVDEIAVKLFRLLHGRRTTPGSVRVPITQH